jgi:hypothetical protein
VLAADKPREEYRFLGFRIERVDFCDFGGPGADGSGETFSRQLFESLLCFGQRGCVMREEGARADDPDGRPGSPNSEKAHANLQVLGCRHAGRHSRDTGAGAGGDIRARLLRAVLPERKYIAIGLSWRYAFDRVKESF